MATNYWEENNEPSSYNPVGDIILEIPVGLTYVLSFTASSVSGGSVYASSWNNTNDLNEVIDLSSTPQDIVLEWTESDTGILYFGDEYGNGDVVIEDIWLYEKGTEPTGEPEPEPEPIDAGDPIYLPTTTIGTPTLNGMPGFLSGEWTIHNNATVIDDETLELNATGNSEITDVDIYLDIGEYTFSFEGNGKLWIKNETENIIVIQDVLEGEKTFSVSEYSLMKVVFYNHTLGSGIYTFKRPMLVKGSTAIPYQPKTGDRMMEPKITGKNVFDIKMFKPVPVDNGRKHLSLRLKPNTFYTMSSNVPGSESGDPGVNRHIYMGTQGVQDAVFFDHSVTYFSGTSGVIDFFLYEDRIYTDEIKNGVYYFQLEEGSISTEYEASFYGIAAYAESEPYNGVLKPPKRLLTPKR